MKAPELDETAWESWVVTMSSVWLCWRGLHGQITPAGALPTELGADLRQRLYTAVSPTATKICGPSGELAAEYSSQCD
jgi:hypothetical protein